MYTDGHMFNMNIELAHVAGAPEDLMAMFRYYRTQPYYHDLRKIEDAIFRGPDFQQWAIENRDALIAKLNS